MKFVTFNIRCDHGHDKENNFVFRKPLIVKKLEQEKADILCFQEVVPHVGKWLRDTLTDYIVVGCGRGVDLRDEEVTVAFRKTRFNLMEMQSYWLSPTPYVPGSRYPEQSNCPRICTELVLEDLEEKKVFRVVNTHLDHVGSLARKLGLSQILNHLAEVQLCPDAPVIVTGDFNAEPDSEEIALISNHPGFSNATKGIGTTYHNFLAPGVENSIDYIFIKGAIACDSVTKWTDVENGVCLSDHYPVCAQLHLQ